MWIQSEFRGWVDQLLPWRHCRHASHFDFCQSRGWIIRSVIIKTFASVKRIGPLHDSNGYHRSETNIKSRCDSTCNCVWNSAVFCGTPVTLQTAGNVDEGEKYRKRGTHLHTHKKKYSEKREKEVIIAGVNTKTLGGRRHHGAGFPCRPPPNGIKRRCQIKKLTSNIQERRE